MRVYRWIEFIDDDFARGALEDAGFYAMATANFGDFLQIFWSTGRRWCRSTWSCRAAMTSNS